MRFSIASLSAWLSLAAICLVAAPCESLAADTQLDAGEQAFVTQVTADSAEQVAFAQMALQKSQNQRVRELAQRIIRNNRALDAQFSPLAPDAAQAAIADLDNNPLKVNLNQLNGAAFDKAFVRMLVWKHQSMISVCEAAELKASHPQVKDMAHSAVFALQDNLTAAHAWLQSATPSHATRENALVASADVRNANLPLMWTPASVVAAPW